MHKDIQYKQVGINDFSPKILSSYLFTDGMLMPEGQLTIPRHVYNYEMEWIIDSRGRQYVENKKYDIEPGDIIIRKPGEYTYGVYPYSCYYICFDLLGTDLVDNYKPYKMYERDVFEPYYKNDLIDGLPTHFRPRFTQKYKDLFKNIFELFLNLNPLSEIRIKAYILELIYAINEDYNSISLDEALRKTKYYNELIQIKTYIENNIEHKIVLEDLAKEVGLSPFHFHKIFTKYMGVTPNKYVTDQKMAHAKSLLIFTNEPIQNVAAACGYDNIQYFSNVFKKYMNISPSSFRKRYRQLAQ